MEILKNPTFFAQLAIGLFLAIVFIQSSLDKIMDWKGNTEWLTSHFANTPLASGVVPMTAVITVVELATGLIALWGLWCLIGCSDPSCILYAIYLSLLAYSMLLFGQRVAKDYVGAQTITVYFGVSLVSLLFF